MATEHLVGRDDWPVTGLEWSILGGCFVINILTLPLNYRYPNNLLNLS